MTNIKTLPERLKKLWNMRVTVIPIVVVEAFEQSPNGLETGGTENQRKNWDHLDYSTVKIS